MNTLDDIRLMKAKDPSGILGSTALFPDQCEQAWTESSKLSFPDHYKQIYNIVVCGMGGSRFPPKTIKELFKKKIVEPYEIVEDYTLPGYVDSDTLVVLSSYSGTTEEVLACARDAISRKAKVTAVTSGGALADLLEKNNFTGYVFKPKFNPCGQPRIGGGYLLMGHLGLLKSLGLVTIKDEEIPEAIAFTREVGKKYGPEIPEKDNQAKQLARLLKDKYPFIITAEFLKGFGNGFANQINETAKMISDYRYISELNHHLLEGLSYPEILHPHEIFVFFLSHCYSEPIQKRFAITKDVVQKQHISTYDIALTGANKISQVLEAFTLSGFTTYYLAMLYDVNPAAIPWVNYFKEKLKSLSPLAAT